MSRIVAYLIVSYLVMCHSSLASDQLIGVAWDNLSQENNRTLEAVIKSAIEAQGNIYYPVDALGSGTKQISDIEALIEKGVKSIIIQPVDVESITPSLRKATSTGIPVVSYGTSIPVEGVIYADFDQVEVGRLQAQAMLKEQPEGDYVFIKGDINDPRENLLMRGQLDVLQKLIDSGSIEVVGEANSDDWRPEAAQKNMEAFLTANNNSVDAVMSFDDQLASGVIAALAEQGLAGSVAVSGGGADKAALERIANGTQTVTIFKDERELGKRVADAAAQLSLGVSPNEITGITKSPYGDGDESYRNALLVAPIAITKENLNVVIDAGWVTKEEACTGIPTGTVAACDGGEGQMPAIDVCFASDRQKEFKDRLQFTSGRASVLTMGFAKVSIPVAVHKFGKIERPEKKWYNYIGINIEKEDESKHFVIKEIKELNKESIISESKSILSRSELYKNHAMIFIHGFNMSFDDALYTSAQISWDMNFDGLPCIYSWPSKGEASLSGYMYDSNSSQQTRKRLAEFLNFISEIPDVEHISIIAHSMGNVALLEALGEMATPTETATKPYSEIILAAPDVDRDNFLSLATSLSVFSDGVTLYASSNDKALLASKILSANIPRAGDVPSDGPLLMKDIDSIDASSVSDYAFGYNHSYFADERTIVADIGRLIRNSERPPLIRDVTFQQVNKSHGTYWRFPD